MILYSAIPISDSINKNIIFQRSRLPLSQKYLSTSTESSSKMMIEMQWFVVFRHLRAKNLSFLWVFFRNWSFCSQRNGNKQVMPWTFSTSELFHFAEYFEERLRHRRDKKSRQSSSTSIHLWSRFSDSTFLIDVELAWKSSNISFQNKGFRQMDLSTHRAVRSFIKNHERGISTK